MPKPVDRLHVHCDFAAVCRLHNRSKLFIEVEVSGCGSGNEPRPTTESEILYRPLNENQNAALELDYVRQMDECPYQPSWESRQVDAESVGDRRPPADHGQTAFIEILEVLLLRFSLELPRNRLRSIRSLLHRNLRPSGQ